MLISRAALTVQALKSLKTNVPRFNQAIRNSSHAWAYRKAPAPPPKWVYNSAEFVQGVAWWWILWHIWTEPGHILGEFEYPDPSKWTDAELGIPDELE